VLTGIGGGACAFASVLPHPELMNANKPKSPVNKMEDIVLNLTPLKTRVVNKMRADLERFNICTERYETKPKCPSTRDPLLETISTDRPDESRAHNQIRPGEETVSRAGEQ